MVKRIGLVLTDYNTLMMQFMLNGSPVIFMAQYHFTPLFVCSQLKYIIQINVAFEFYNIQILALSFLPPPSEPPNHHDPYLVGFLK